MGLAGWGEDIRANAAAVPNAAADTVVAPSATMNATAAPNAAVNSASSLIWEQFVAQSQTAVCASEPTVPSGATVATLSYDSPSNGTPSNADLPTAQPDKAFATLDLLCADDASTTPNPLNLNEAAAVPSPLNTDTPPAASDAAPDAVTGDAPTPTLKATADDTPTPERFMPAPVSSKAANDEVVSTIRNLRLWPSPEDKNTCDISLIELHEVGFVLKHAARFDDLDYYKLAREAQQVKRQLLEVGAAPDSLSSPNLDKLIEFLEKKYEENN